MDSFYGPGAATSWRCNMLIGSYIWTLYLSLLIRYSPAPMTEAPLTHHEQEEMSWFHTFLHRIYETCRSAWESWQNAAHRREVRDRLKGEMAKKASDFCQ